MRLLSLSLLVALLLFVGSPCSATGTVRMVDSSLTVREGETVSVCVVATLSAPGQSVEVGLTSSSDQDLPVPSTTLMLDNNTLTTCWTITAADDSVYEDDTEMVTLTLEISSQSGGVTLGDPRTTDVSVMDTDVVTVQMPGTVVTVDEGENARVCATISGARERVVMVQLETTDLSEEKPASSSSDYHTSSMDTEFSSTVSEVCLLVQTISEDPPVYEYFEVFNVTLSIINPNTNSRVRSGGLTTTVRITDKHRARVLMMSPSITQNERDGNVTVCAQLNSPAGGTGREIFITLTRSENSQSDFVFPSGSPMGTTECLVLPVVDNSIFEQSPLLSETVTLSKTGGQTQGRVDLTSTETSTMVTVNDDDNAAVTLQTPSPLTRSEGDGNIRVCATLTSPSGGIGSAVTVQLLNALVITFPSPSSMGVVGCTDISNVENDVYEDDRELMIQLSSMTQRVTAIGSATITIRDDDDVTVSMMRSSITQFENGGDVRVYATLDAPSGGIRKDVPVTFTVTRPSTQATTTKTITFSSGSPQGSQRYITITVQDNEQFQVSPVAEYTVTLSAPGNSRVSVGSTEMTSVTIDDDDDVTVIIPGSMTYNESDSDIRVCGELTSPSGGLATGQSVTVTLTAAGQQPENMDVTFQPGSIRQQCVTYSVTDDDVYESGPVQTFSVTLSTVQSRVIANGTTTVTVNDDDNPVVALQQLSYSFYESTPEVTGDICVILEGPAGGLSESVQVQFDISTAGLSRTATFSTDFTTAGTTQTREFTSSDSVGAMKCISVRIIDDDVADPDEMFRVQVTPLTARVSVRGSSSTTITIINDDVLPSPRNLRSHDVTSRSVSLSWNAPESNSFGIRLTGYTVSWNSESRSIAAPTTTALITNLVPHQQYQFSVNTNFEGGNFGESVSTNVMTLQDVPTSPPTALTLLSSTTSSLTLSWSPPAEPNGVITHYTLYTDYQNGSVSVSTASATLSPLTPYQTVSVEVSASTIIGEGPRTVAMNFTTNEAVSGRIGDFNITRINETVLYVCWTEPTDLNGMLLHYSITVRLEGASAGEKYNTTLPKLTLTNLAPYTPYEISVSAVNGAGVGNTRTTTEFTVEGTPVSHPRDITVTRVSPTSAIVSWTPLTLSEARGFVTEYNVTYWRSDSVSGVTVRVPGNESSVVISNLDADSDYLFTVSVGTAEGASNVSDAIIIQREGNQIEVGIIVGAVGGVIIVVLVILFLIIFIVCIKRRQRSDKFSPKENLKPKPKPLPPPKPKNVYFDLELNEKAKEVNDGSKNTTDTDDEEDTSFLLPEQCENFSQAISVADFAGHVKDLHRNSNQGFEREYKSIKNGNHSWDASQLPYNKAKKNRFTNIFPYDYCRVKLKSTGSPGSDYINASWLNGYKRDNAYVAAQGPMPDTVDDFWRMVWEHKLCTIVMVTKLVENGREKCQRYWPSGPGEVTETGTGIVVTLMEVKVFTDYEIRVMSVTNESEPGVPMFMLTHFYYLGWPDHGVPEYATSILGFLRRVRKSHPISQSPLLVHCSAGVGRTGTFIVMDAILQQIHAEKTVNVYQFVQELRERRCQMVQTVSQYVFIHDALDELITCGDTEIAACNLNISINQLSKKYPGKSVSRFDEQFQLLEQVSRTPTQKDRNNIENLDVEEKNRYPNRFPYDAHRPVLNGSTKREQYINASFIDGYKQRRCFVATQAPLPNTVVDLWRMVWKQESRTIVMLCDLVENGREVCAHYWPTRNGEEVKYGKVIIKLLSEETDQGIVKRKLELSPTVKMTSSDSYVLTLYQFLNWNEYGTQPSPESVINLNDLVVNRQKSTGNKPIIVMCNDGCGRTGTFMSVYSCVDRFKVEAVVDVFQCVKAARIQRMALVSNVEQYKLVFHALQQYMMSFDQYANFTDVI